MTVTLEPRQADQQPAGPCSQFMADPGDLLVLSAATWHRAGTNLTDQPRVAVLLNFVEGWVRPMAPPPVSGF